MLPPLFRGECSRLLSHLEIPKNKGKDKSKFLSIVDRTMPIESSSVFCALWHKISLSILKTSLKAILNIHILLILTHVIFAQFVAT